MHIKFFSLSCVLVYALLSASPALHCHGLEASTGHEDHCQGCQYTFASSAVFDKTTTPVPVYDPVGPAIAGPELDYSQTSDALYWNRAPPPSPA